MVDSYFVEQRRKCKQDFLEYINKNSADQSLDQILGMYSFKTGFKVSRLQLWIEEMVMAGILKLDNQGQLVK